MGFVPPWSNLTLPRRGHSCAIDLDIADALAIEYRMARRARNAATIAAREPDSDIDSELDNLAIPDDDDYDISSVSSRSTNSWVLSSNADTDSEGSDFTMDVASVGTAPILRPRPIGATVVDMDVSPIPDSFTRSHLVSLGFECLEWKEQPGALVDLRDRVGAMYIGRPTQASAWENTIIYAGQEMLNAQESVSRCTGVMKRSLAAGLKCGGPGAAFRKVAPVSWASSKDMLASLLDHDMNLRLPFQLPAMCGTPQPTAFSRVDYRFDVDDFIRREEESYTPGFTALTALGHYHHDEGELVLWLQKKVVNFPVGSTFLIPKWMPYSFTSVESPGYQMIMSQTCENSLAHCLLSMNRLRDGANVLAASPGPPPVAPTANSIHNPMCVDENGRVVRNLRNSRTREDESGRTSGRMLSIYRGPPSLIPQDIPRISPLELELRSLGAPRLARLVQARNRPYPSHYHPITGAYIGLSTMALIENRPRSSAATTVRRPDRWRLRRPTPLLPGEHECSLCEQVRSHPVKYKCGHGHCYVCIRIHLETSWKCPTCDVLMTRAPKPDPDAELLIQLHHTRWIDESFVTGSWDGLHFPKLPRRAVSTS
ncbi:hypothetical protein DFH06DRAFT_1316425 [Mycena polygramma]|nr:hypothetical protein DFH06DRAFT_1316425 [Mycena polygramma]